MKIISFKNLPSCHSGEHMVCIIQMGKVASKIATPMFPKQIEPGGREKMQILYKFSIN